MLWAPQINLHLLPLYLMVTEISEISKPRQIKSKLPARPDSTRDTVRASHTETHGYEPDCFKNTLAECVGQNNVVCLWSRAACATGQSNVIKGKTYKLITCNLPCPHPYMQSVSVWKTCSLHGTITTWDMNPSFPLTYSVALSQSKS